MGTSQFNDTLDLTKEDDLRFCRLTITQARRDFDPGTSIFITWGLVCFAGYIGIHYLVLLKYFKWIYPFIIGLCTVGIIGNVYFGLRLCKQQRLKGYISHIDNQINWIWWISVSNGFLWSTLGYFKDSFGGPGFFWALIYALALSI